MNIAYFNYEWDPRSSTGAATHMAEMAAALERMGHRVRIFDLHRKPAERRRISGREPSRWLWEPANYWRSLKGVYEETKILERERPDIVLVRHALRFSAVAAAHRVGLPAVLEVNAPVPFEIRRYRPNVRLLPGFAECVERRTLRAADGVFVVSSALRDYFLGQGLNRERLAVIPNGADIKRFTPQAADPDMRRRYPGRTLVGFAGSFGRFHGIDVLEQAIRRVAAQEPGVHFVLAGDGPSARQLRYHLAGEPYVTFLGRLPYERVPGFLAAMQVLVAPYPAESFFYFSPIKLFEYMACGRAVLSAALGQIAEVIEDGVNGRLYDPWAPDDFVNKLLELVRESDQCARLGVRARQTIERSFTWSHNARLVNDVLERALRISRQVRSPRWATSFPLPRRGAPAAFSRWRHARKP